MVLNLSGCMVCPLGVEFGQRSKAVMRLMNDRAGVLVVVRAVLGKY